MCRRTLSVVFARITQHRLAKCQHTFKTQHSSHESQAFLLGVQRDISSCTSWVRVPSNTQLHPAAHLLEKGHSGSVPSETKCLSWEALRKTFARDSLRELEQNTARTNRVPLLPTTYTSPNFPLTCNGLWSQLWATLLCLKCRCKIVCLEGKGTERNWRSCTHQPKQTVLFGNSARKQHSESAALI